MKFQSSFIISLSLIGAATSEEQKKTIAVGSDLGGTGFTQLHRVLLGQSAATAIAIGLVLATLIPLFVVPLTRFLKRHKRSINRHLENKDKPADYTFVVTRTIVMSGAATGVFLHIAANSNNILWSLTDATPATLIKTFVGMFFIREFFAYWSHRLFHSKLLYYKFHAEHHAILHVHDDYDGYYIDFFETAVAAFIAYLPAFIIPKVHVIAVIIFEVFAAFFVFSVNHCGRDVRIAFNWSFGYAKPLVLYDSQHHDDHHVLRRGNYAELLPILDTIFGTAVVVESRRPLPAQELWKKAQKVKAEVKVTAAFKNTGNRRPSVLHRAYGSIRHLCEEEEGCGPQWERYKDSGPGRRSMKLAERALNHVPPSSG